MDVWQHLAHSQRVDPLECIQGWKHPTERIVCNKESAGREVLPTAMVEWSRSINRISVKQGRFGEMGRTSGLVFPKHPRL